MMSHVDEAVTEMFRAVHMQLLGNTCRLEKMLLAALVTETRATGKSAAHLTDSLFRRLIHETWETHRTQPCLADMPPARWYTSSCQATSAGNAHGPLGRGTCATGQQGASSHIVLIQDS